MAWGNSPNGMHCSCYSLDEHPERGASRPAAAAAGVCCYCHARLTDR